MKQKLFMRATLITYLKQNRYRQNSASMKTFFNVSFCLNYLANMTVCNKFQPCACRIYFSYPF